MKQLLPLLLLLTLTACSREEQAPQADNLPAVNAELCTPLQTLAPHNREVSGTVQPVIQAEISPRLVAEIVAIPVETGQLVEKGTLLVHLDDSAPAAALRQAQVALGQAERNLARESRLLKKHAATPTSVKNLRDAVDIAKAQLSQARINLDYTRIRAPFTGIISAIPANIGDLATPGRPLLHLEEMSRLEVVADIPESLLASVHKGDSLPIVIPSAGVSLTGNVTEISPAVNPASRTAPAKLALTAQGEERSRIFSGMFARITLTEGTPQSKSLFVPASAIHHYGQMQQLFLLNDGQAELRLVRLGNTRTINGTKMVEVLSGLDAEEQVLLTDAGLQNGQPVTTSAASHKE